MTNDDWKLDAACRGQTAIFFAPHRERPQAQIVREAQALLICSSCPVIEPCAEAAVGERGIWAGQREDHFT